MPFLPSLITLLGADYVLTKPDQMQAYCVDYRGRYHGRALAVALPNSREQVIELVRLAAKYGVPIVAQGGNTSTCGAATPDSSGQHLLLNFKRLNRVIAVDTMNSSMTVESGVTLAQAQNAAAAVGQLFPLSLASEGSCQIGGNLSTNAGGLAVLRYGTMRDLTLGLEVVLAQGQVLNLLSTLRKDSSGLDLKQLFIGAEGQLGLITAATLKLFPKASAYATAFIGLDDMASALNWLSELKDRFNERLSRFEMMSDTSLTLLQRYSKERVPFIAPWAVLFELSDTGSETELNQALVAYLAQRHYLDAVIAQNNRERAALWRLREDISACQKQHGPSIKHDIALPSSALALFVNNAQQALQKRFASCLIVAFGHAGDGNLHYNVSLTRPDNVDLFQDEDQVNQIVYDEVYRLGGTLAAEHGIGQLKSHWLAHYKDPIALQTMVTLKKLLDPAGLMNPGKWLSDKKTGDFI